MALTKQILRSYPCKINDILTKIGDLHVQNIFCLIKTCALIQKIS